jgi:hypothetical protein
MKVISYATCFRKLKLTEPISGFEELIPGVNISNDPAVREKWLTPEFAKFWFINQTRITDVPPQSHPVGLCLHPTGAY